MLTPNHLIFGRTVSPLPYGEGILEDVSDDDLDFNDEDWNRGWRRLSKKLEYFKKQYQEEYMAYLRHCHQIKHHEDPVEEVKIDVGDLVIMKSDTEKLNCVTVFVYRDKKKNHSICLARGLVWVPM